MRPPQGIQRGSVADMTHLSRRSAHPRRRRHRDAKRLTRETSPTILKIPALPISYADAQVLLGAMDGVVAPPNWRGHLAITYRVDRLGPGASGGEVGMEPETHL